MLACVNVRQCAINQGHDTSTSHFKTDLIVRKATNKFRFGFETLSLALCLFMMLGIIYGDLYAFFYTSYSVSWDPCRLISLSLHLKCPSNCWLRTRFLHKTHKFTRTLDNIWAVCVWLWYESLPESISNVYVFLTLLKQQTINYAKDTRLTDKLSSKPNF